MPYNYQDLASTTLPPEIEMPPGLREDANYVFSVTYTDPDAMALKEFLIVLDCEALCAY